jgi:hypothetical protein
MIVGVTVRLIIGVQTIDDAFITFRYSEHIATGQGFTYNPPDHILGTSTPLFALVMAGMARLGLDLQIAAFTIALLADLLSMALFAAILTRLGYPLAAQVGVIALALAPSVVLYSVSGMETSLYVALLLLAFWAVDRAWWKTAAVAAGAAWFCRPDGVLVVAAVCGAAWLSLPWRRAVAVTLIAGGVMVPWVTFAFVYFGSPIPGSIVAKADMAKDALAGFRVFKNFFLTWPAIVPSLLAALGVVLLWTSQSRVARTWVAWGAVYTIVFSVSRAFDGYMWYFTPLMPLYFAAVAVSLDAGVRLVGARKVAVSMVTVAAVAAVLAYQLRGAVVHTLQSQATREQRYKVIAARLVAERSDCPLAAQEIGALGYYYPGRILDLAGIVSPEAVGRPRGEVLRESTACWLVNYDENLEALDPAIFKNDWFSATFTVIDELRVTPTRKLIVYRRNPGT